MADTVDSINQKREQRFLFLHRLYEMTDGDEHAMVNMRQVGEPLGLEEKACAQVVQYLVGEHLVERRAMGGIISITHFGVTQVEAALTKPDEPTQYFPPVVNILSVQSMVNSQIQQGSQHSTQTGTFTQTAVQAGTELLKSIKDLLPSLALDTETQEDAQEAVALAETQLASRRPNVGIIRECFHTLRNVLEGAAGSAVAVGAGASAAHLLPVVTAFLQSLPH